MNTPPPLSMLRFSNTVNISVGVIVHKEGKYLLIQEKGIQDALVWNFPSGKVNYREDIAQAAKREVFEETGLSIKIVGLVSIYYYRTKLNSYDRKKDRITVRFNFWAECEAQLPESNTNKTEVNASWLNRGEIRRILDEHKFRNWIAERLAEESLKETGFSLDLLYTNL